MPAELPWSELVRRRNGLPARTEASAEQLLTNLPHPYGGVPEFIPGNPDIPPQHVVSMDDIEDVYARFQARNDRIRMALGVLAATAAERCPHTELPTTMCHHCKETQ